MTFTLNAKCYISSQFNLFVANPDEIKKINESIEVMSNLTCVKFVPVTEAPYKELGHNNSVKFTAIR